MVLIQKTAFPANNRSRWDWCLLMSALFVVLNLAGCPQQESPCLDCNAMEDAQVRGDIVTPPAKDVVGWTEPELVLPLACDEIYDNSHLPTFEITISASAWATLQDEYDNWDSPRWKSKPLSQYQPLDNFRYQDEWVPGAAIRLKGSTDHWNTGKMQFNISFKQYDGKGRFHGLRKLNLDAPHCDPSMMHDRLGMALFRDLGLPAPCCNHVRLVVNGEYYGLFVNIEQVDQEFLYRNFGHDDEGNLYKYNKKKTHESDPLTPDLDQFEADLPLPELEQLLDLNQALLFWAMEAVIPHFDGYVVGGNNYYLYNHPKRGLLLIPWDLDYSFEIDAEHTYYDLDPMGYEVGYGHGKPHHMKTVLADEEWLEAYYEALAVALAAYDSDTLIQRTALWEEQISEALSEDPNLYFGMDEHEDRVALLEGFVAERAVYLYSWLACKNETTYLDNAQSLTFEEAQYSLWFNRCNWADAKVRCESLGGHLALPGSEGEQNFLADSLLELEDENWWIGITDAENEGQWIMADGSLPGYDGWDSDQPNGGPDQNCGVIAHNIGGEWNDKSCHEMYPSICRLP